MTLGDVLARATDYLAGRGFENPRRDAELLLARSLGLARIELYTNHDRPLTDAERTAARELVQRRGQREPLAYVLGDWDFRRLTLKADRRALVPRPETEVLVERCLELLEGPFDLVVSNPPYVEADELESLEPEVRDWEPRGALVDDGQTARLVRDAGQVLSGWLVLEVHEARADAVSHELEREGYSRIGITNDLAGKERVVEAWWGTTPSTA